MKKKTTFEEKLPFILAFVLPVLIMLGIFAGKEIYPFGENSFLRTDLYHQYVAFFQNYAERVRAGESLTYAWDIGLGSNYSALYAYYLCGPLHLLAFLVPDGFIIEFITYLIVLKIGLCGLAMAWYLYKHFNTRHIAIAFCGVCYALSGYLAAYSWNIMWLDVLWLTPIVLYGVELLVEKNKPFLYCITLGLAILCNYYICIMLCIFLVFYFICRVICLPKKSFKIILQKCLLFGFFSLLAGALACVLVIPAAYALQGTASANSTFPSTITNYFGILEMLSRHLCVVEVETGLDHWPNLYCGVAVFLLVPLYYLNKDVDYKEKLVNTLLIGFMLLGFNTNVLNYIWHGMHYPNSLPCRQSYLYNFVILVMCFEGIRGIAKQPKSKLLGCMWGAIGLILILEAVCDPDEIPYYACYASILFICLYTFFAYMHKTRRISALTAASMTLCVLIIEMGLNTAVTSVSFVNRTSFVQYDECYDKFIEQAEKDEVFTRIERNSLRSKNDGPYFGYNSASIFSSTTNADISTLYKKLGLEGNTNAYAFTGATPLMYSMFSVKYRISDSKLPSSPLYELIATEENAKGYDCYLYENKYTLPLGYLVPYDTDIQWTYSTGGPAKVQNSYVNVTTGVGNVLEEVNSTVNGATLTGLAAEDGFYFVSTSGSVTKVSAAVNGGSSKTWDNLGRGYLINLGCLKAGDTYTVTASEGNSIGGTVYRFDNERFIEAYNILKEHPFEIKEFVNTRKETRISGKVTADEKALLTFSIPYEEGCWTVTVDGKEEAIMNFADALVAVYVTPGTHTVELSYTPRGLKLGATISAAALFLLLFLIVITYIYRNVRKKNAPFDEEPSLVGADPDAENEAVSASSALNSRMEALKAYDEQEQQRKTAPLQKQPEESELRRSFRAIRPAERAQDAELLAMDKPEEPAPAPEMPAAEPPAPEMPAAPAAEAIPEAPAESSPSPETAPTAPTAEAPVSVPSADSEVRSTEEMEATLPWPELSGDDMSEAAADSGTEDMPLILDLSSQQR